MTYLTLNITRICKDIQDIKNVENERNIEDKRDTQNKLKSPKKVMKKIIKKNKSMDDFMTMQWPWII